ncbi:MAG TPA: Wzz/FepE/Etk N-terminal domain-containing protein [Methylocella sp.]|jgi:uncharacterized protein involved in exopolysaccharide biosynthesis
MEFYRIWRILTGHKWVLIWLPIVATFVGLAVTYVLPEQYESVALVLARPYEDIKFNSSGGDRKEVRDFPVNLSAPIDAPSKTYMEVITSPAVAVKIVEALKLDIKKPKTYGGGFDAFKDNVKTWVKNTVRTTRNYFKYGRDIPASPFELAVEDIETNLLVSARKDTYAFDITYKSSDPNEAAAVANMAAEIFLEHSSGTYRNESARAREFFETQVDESRKALDQARAAILAYKSSGGTFELKSEYEEKLKIVSDLNDTLAKTEGKLAGQRIVAARSHLNYSPLVVAAEAEIAELKAQISTLQEQLTAYPNKEKRMNDLLLTERLAQESYEFFLKDYEEARVKEAATTTEIRIASRAVPGLYPVKPLKYVYAGLSFATALVVAIGWVLFYESLNPRIRTIRDLDDELGVPVLAAIPALKALTFIRASD